MLKIYNSLTRNKDKFIPLTQNEIKIYVCGITVYDYCHIGHARVLVSFDVITRYLRSIGYKVTYVRNITDIDDKIIQRSQEKNINFHELTNYFIKAMHEDEKALLILPPDHEPKASEHIDEIINLIQKLIANGHAYVAENGDVYYDISTFKDYGKLSQKDLQGQEAGARIDIVSVKKNAMDFVLWKQAKLNEPQWLSPWGQGRPGWHIECSAMSMKLLGENFDIHGGGFDLQFPHHENEIAQSCGATNQDFANTWMHVGYLQINREKMSKSKNNFFTIREVLQKFHPETIRYFLLSSHYRSQLNYAIDNLKSSHGALLRLYICLQNLDLTEITIDPKDEHAEKFHQAMQDDFNTPEALAVLFNLTHEINSLKSTNIDLAQQKAKLLKTLANSLGLLKHPATEFIQGNLPEAEIQKIEELIQQREQARNNKDWQKADKIRQYLAKMGIELQDGTNKTDWSKN